MLERETSPKPLTITKPTDTVLLEQLTLKSAEYKERAFTMESDDDMYKHPELMLTLDGNMADALLKSYVLDRVLEEGSVTLVEVYEGASEDPLFWPVISTDPALFKEKIDNAFGVISAYCSGDLDRLTGGTGLRQPDQTPSLG